VLGLAWLTAGRDGEAGEWFEQAWTYTKMIVPLLLGGVLVAGFLLGRPGHEGLIPSEWIGRWWAAIRWARTCSRRWPAR
jgi:uncharacterized protein